MGKVVIPLSEELWERTRVQMFLRPTDLDALHAEAAARGTNLSAVVNTIVQCWVVTITVLR